MNSILSILNCYNTPRKGFIMNYQESSYLLYKVIQYINITTIPKYQWRILNLLNEYTLPEINTFKFNNNEILNIKSSFEEAISNIKITSEDITNLKNDHLSSCMNIKLSSEEEQINISGGNMTFDLDAETEQKRIESDIEGLIKDINIEYENNEMNQCGGNNKKKWRLKR